jgi:hypothetical protein
MKLFFPNGIRPVDSTKMTWTIRKLIKRVGPTEKRLVEIEVIILQK